MKKALKLIGNITMLIIIISAVMSAYSMNQYRKNPDRLPAIFGYSNMSVLSGSMRTYLEPGDMIIDKSVNIEEVKIGDVVTYRSGSSFVTHRVVRIIEEGGKLLLYTRGDANNTDDGKPVTKEQLIGKVVLRIPYGGYVASFIRSPIGLLLIIVIPVSFMLFGEVKNILSGGKKEEEEDKPDPKTV